MNSNEYPIGAAPDPWARPLSVDALDLTFGGNMESLLPPMSAIPEEFHNLDEKWSRVVSTWFYSGLKGAVFAPKHGIDKRDALRHVGAILASCQPKHEHKTAGCAYLLSKWFDGVEIPKATGSGA